MELTLEIFNKKFHKEKQGYKDKTTGKIYYCPHDLGFSMSIKDCIEYTCKECWQEIEDYLRFKEVGA